MLARVSELSVATLVHRVPGADQPGSGQSLHAHIRNVDHGKGPEPQEGGRQPQSDLESVLYQQSSLLRFPPSTFADRRKAVLFTFCALNELFFIALYLLSFSSPTLSPDLLKPVADSVHKAHSAALSLFPNPYSAGALELARANKMDSFWPWVLAGISFPIMAAKQFINVVQLVKASRWLAEGDMTARKRQGLPRKSL